jgi:hypothetical protein
MEFIWAVAESGYEIVEASGVRADQPEQPESPRTGRFISARAWGGPRYCKRYYSPFAPEYRALPRWFAELNGADEESVLRFANQYGTLGDPQCYFIKDSRGWYSRLAEPIEIWKSEAAAMAVALELWDSAKSGDRERILSLGFMASQHYEIRLYFTSPAVDFARRDISFHADPIVALRPSERVQFEKLGLRHTSPALERLAEAYERQHHPPHFDFAAGKLLRLVNYKLTNRVRPQLFWAPDGSGLEGHDAPVDLLGAMWQLLFDAICAKGEHKRCLCCRGWYEVSTASSRMDRQYCSDACRMKEYRRRKSKRSPRTP